MTTLSIQIRPFVCLVIALMVSGCNKGETASDAQPERMQEEPRLVLLSWEEYICSNVVSQFVEETGIELIIEEFGSHEQLEARMQEDLDTYDLAVVDDSIMNAYIELKLLQRYDKNQIPNLTRLEPTLTNRPTDPDADYSIPYFWGLNVLIYNKRLVKTPPESWLDLWRPEFKGKIGLMDDPWEYLALGCIKATGNFSMADSNTWPDAGKSFESLIPSVGNISEFDDIIAEVGEGKLLIGNSYNGDAVAMGADYPDLVTLLPNEGAMVWVDVLVLSRKSKQPKNAHRFINFILRPDIASKNANTVAYPPVVSGVLDQIEPELLNNSSIFPQKELLDRCLPYPHMTVELRETLDRLAALANQRRTELNVSGRQRPD